MRVAEVVCSHIVMDEVIHLKELFFASTLVDVILQNEVTNHQEYAALVALGNQIALSSFTANLKTFSFVARSQEENIQVGILRLRVVKGSIFTYIWNTFARVDDEYILEYEYSSMTTSIIKDIWRLRGMDPWNSKIVSAEVNWTNMRSIYNGMGISIVGVLAFARLLGRILISLPNYYKERIYLAPMPATFM